ncbi:hypothetical protein [Mariniflexile sp. AS56]|uniref:hypothetical protein n=1 Tax=Mariniflexile sp. AS56 TaxID=3063957 RepID=UPI0026F2A457|nr:hypothetical protein [Mariniflexile sp. AS56]MDO7171952.1 hypothetical protein [Mariniflexile sp. AS56]
MNKSFVVWLLLFCGFLGNSQSFTYNKVSASGQNIKLKGVITVCDTLISIHTNGNPANFKVKKTLEAGDTKQFKALETGDNAQIRITLNNPANPTKLAPKSLLLETKDEFSGTYTVLMYYLEDVLEN